MGANEAVQYIWKRRNCANPNPSFRSQLKTFETQHRPFHVTVTKFESEGDRQKERKEKTNIATFANVKVNLYLHPLE